VHRPHPANRFFGRDCACQIEPVVLRLRAALARILPLVRVAHAFAFRLTQLSGLRGLDPYDRIGAGDVRKFKLIDAGGGILGLLACRIVNGGHVGRVADIQETGIGILNARGRELSLAPNGRVRMLGDGRIALADDG